MVDGGSHSLRLIEPFPPRIVRALGAYVWDEDENQILDFWQGHFANLLGHNPPCVTETLAECFAAGYGLQAGFADRWQIEAAETLCRQTGAERVRFTTSGTLATMYAVLLARTFTGRELVMKVGGGWHGAQPWGLKGVEYRAGSGFDHADSQGLPSGLIEQVLVTRYNDSGMLRDQFRQYGDRLACFIVEPFVGGGGGIPARREYLQEARQMADQYGVVLILDEVISGFRFRAGDLGALYGVHPDLATFGKIIGGGMPVTAVAGRAEIMNRAGRPGGGQVKFSGGTYSGHPASMLAARTMMAYLVEYEHKIYPRLADLGEAARRTAEETFAAEGILVRSTGAGEDLPCGSSFVQLHFPYNAEASLNRPEEVLNPAVCDVQLGEQVLKLAMLVEDVHVAHGLGALSTAHNEKDTARLGDAYQRVARQIRQYL